MAKKNDKRKGKPAPRSREKDERDPDEEHGGRDPDRGRDRDRGDRGRSPGRRSGGGRKPMYSIAFSYKTGDGDWERGPSLGVWPTEVDNAIGQGSVKDAYLRDLRRFLRDAAEDGGKASFTIFKNKKSRDRDNRDQDDDRDEPTERERDDNNPF